MRLIEKFLFYLLIFSIPFQTRVILYQWGGNFIEWNSAFLYFTDILILLLLGFWVWRKRFRVEIKGANASTFLLCGFLLLAFLSLIKSVSTPLSYYHFLKLSEFILLFFYIQYNFRDFFNLRRVCQVLVISGVFQSFIAIVQYTIQGSLGLKWLGESSLDGNIPGVAKFLAGGTKMIRAYGTFPHPNLLATFLLISLFALCYLYLERKHKTSFLLVTRHLLLIALIILGLFLTFSRAVIFIGAIAILFYFLLSMRAGERLENRKVMQLFLLFFIPCVLFTILLWPEISSRLNISLGEQALDLRFFYNRVSFSMIKKSPFLGMGIGNFVWNLPGYQPFLRAAHQFTRLFGNVPTATDAQIPAWLYQPVHNVYLLIASEIGIIGLGAFLIFLVSLLWRFKRLFRTQRGGCFILLSLCFLFIAFFDHFFWTLQQGRLMWWVVFGLIASLPFLDK